MKKIYCGATGKQLHKIDELLFKKSKNLVSVEIISTKI